MTLHALPYSLAELLFGHGLIGEVGGVYAALAVEIGRLRTLAVAPKANRKITAVMNAA
jgi:hypothetical protein